MFDDPSLDQRLRSWRLEHRSCTATSLVIGLSMRVAPVDRILETIISPEDFSSIDKCRRTEYSKRSRNFSLGSILVTDFFAVRSSDHGGRVKVEFLQDAAKRRSRAWVPIFDEPGRIGCLGELGAPSFE